MLCSAPLDSQNILGYGFEVSAMLFKLSMPDYSTYSRIFCAGTSFKGYHFTSGAMLSGGYSFKKNTLVNINIEEKTQFLLFI